MRIGPSLSSDVYDGPRGSTSRGRVLPSASSAARHLGRSPAAMFRESFFVMVEPGAPRSAGAPALDVGCGAADVARTASARLPTRAPQEFTYGRTRLGAPLPGHSGGAEPARKPPMSELGCAECLIALRERRRLCADHLRSGLRRRQTDVSMSTSPRETPSVPRWSVHRDRAALRTESPCPAPPAAHDCHGAHLQSHLVRDAGADRRLRPDAPVSRETSLEPWTEVPCYQTRPRGAAVAGSGNGSIPPFTPDRADRATASTVRGVSSAEDRRPGAHLRW
jgi:hypothetical protein